MTVWYEVVGEKWKSTYVALGDHGGGVAACFRLCGHCVDCVVFWVVYKMEGLKYETTFGMSLFHDVDCGVNAQPEGSPRSHFS